MEELWLACCGLTCAARFPCTFPFRDFEDGCVSVLPPAQVYFFAGGNPLSIRMITRQPRLFSCSLVPDFPKTWTSACQTSWLLSAAFGNVLTKWQQQKTSDCHRSQPIVCALFSLISCALFGFCLHQLAPVGPSWRGQLQRKIV